jgi:hypothetical protein
MNRKLGLLLTAFVVLIGCKTQGGSQPVGTAKEPAKVDATPSPTAEPTDALMKSVIEKEVAFLGWPADDPIRKFIYVDPKTVQLTLDQKNRMRDLKALFYLDAFLRAEKEHLDKTVNGEGDLKKASNDYDLALLRSDLIHGDIKAGRSDRAILRIRDMTKPMTSEEQAMIAIRRGAADAKSSFSGEQR